MKFGLGFSRNSYRLTWWVIFHTESGRYCYCEGKRLTRVTVLVFVYKTGVKRNRLLYSKFNNV